VPLAPTIHNQWLFVMGYRLKVLYLYKYEAQETLLAQKNKFVFREKTFIALLL